MSDQPNQDGKRFDPMEPWRGVRDIYMDAWAKTMVEMVNSDAYGKATGMMLDSYLTASTPFREAVEKAMLKTLEQLAMPSRADFVSIAERMTNIEMKLDDLDAKLDAFFAQRNAHQHEAARPASPPRPAQKTARPVSPKAARPKPARKGKK
jgi:hypothetical protein